MTTTTFSIRLADDLRTALEVEAKKRGMTIAEVIRLRLSTAESVSANIEAIAAMVQAQGSLVRSSLDALIGVVAKLAEQPDEARATNHPDIDQYAFFSSVFSAALVKRIVARQGDPLAWPAQARAEAISHLERVGVPTEGLL